MADNKGPRRQRVSVLANEMLIRDGWCAYSRMALDSLLPRVGILYESQHGH